MMRSKWVNSLLIYGVGVLCLFVFFLYLQYQCIFNITSLIDGLWLKKLDDDLVENLMGEIALVVHGADCGAKYLYSAQYHPNRMNVAGKVRSLTSMVDVTTWRVVGNDSTTVTYIDSRYKYVLHTTSDGEYIQVINR